MSEVIYLLCAGTSMLCAVMLLRGYRATRTRLSPIGFLQITDLTTVR